MSFLTLLSPNYHPLLMRLAFIKALFFYLPGWIWGQVEGGRVANVVGEKVISKKSKKNSDRKDKSTYEKVISSFTRSSTWKIFTSTIWWWQICLHCAIVQGLRPLGDLMTQPEEELKKQACKVKKFCSGFSVNISQWLGPFSICILCKPITR